MKHLKKYNQSKVNEDSSYLNHEDINLLNEIFIVLVEDWGAKPIKLPSHYDYHSYYEIMIPVPSMVNTPRELGVDKSLVEYLDSYIEKSSKLQDFCNEIKVCLKRVESFISNAQIEYSVVVNESVKSIRIEIYHFEK